MPRYVDVDKIGIGFANPDVFENKSYADGWNSVIKIINEQPTADVVGVKHGKWNINCDGYYPYCSECGYEPERPCFHKDNRTPYCPNCGAKMHLEVESTTYCTDKKNHLRHCEDCYERECER